MFRSVRFFSLGAVMVLSWWCAFPVSAADVYVQDFEDPSDPLAEWSNQSTSVTPVGARRFLGQFGSQSVALDLTGIPPHTKIAVSFDLFIIRSWDGDGNTSTPPGYGTPDRFRLRADGDTLMDSSFKVGNGISQSYPVDLGQEAYPGSTGAAEQNTLGYLHNGNPNDAVYRLVSCFEHDNSTLTLEFSGIDLQGLSDEAWGIDNVRVSVPEYCSEFENLNDPLLEWSNAAADVTPVGARSYLGQYGNGGNTLTLSSLPVHSGLRIEVDLYLLRSWDGNGASCCPGPDRWQIDVDGDNVFDCTFTNGGSGSPDQSYPAPYPAVNAPRTGAKEINSLGYQHDGNEANTVYHLEIVVPHSATSAAIDFAAIGLQGISDESWGIDKLVVNAVDLPSALFIRGDGNGDGTFNGLVDGIFLLAFQFSAGAAPPCMEAADADGDGIFNGLVDGIRALNHQFSGAPAPPAPYPNCGLDPDPGTTLGCLSPPCP